MQATGGGNSDRAVSHVVGTVLIVGITVILMTTVGAFAFGLSSDAGTETPQFGINCDTDAEVITHDRGDSVEGENLGVANSGYDIDDRTFTAGDELVPSSASVDVTLDTRITYSRPGGGSTTIAECGP